MRESEDLKMIPGFIASTTRWMSFFKLRLRTQEEKQWGLRTETVGKTVTFHTSLKDFQTNGNMQHTAVCVGLQLR